MAVDVAIQPATLADAAELGPRLREADWMEVMALGFVSGEDALKESMAVSETALAARFSGELAAVFGLAPGPRKTALSPPEFGIPWLLTGNAVARSPREFLRTSRAVVGVFLARYELLTALVDERYGGALRWAAWLGFRVGPPVPYGPRAMSFRPISIRRSSWVQ